jgi:hypothetical protein
MTLTVEFWQILSLLGVLLGGQFATGRMLLLQVERRLDERFDQSKLLLGQIERRLDERFEQTDQRLNLYAEAVKEEQTQRVRLERDLLQLRVELAERYMRNPEHRS